MLSRLIYVSVRKSDTSEATVQDILASSVRNNGKLDISGVLLYSDSHFFQYLEGEAETIERLYEEIKDDSRHANVVLISKGPIDQRVFPSWEMGGKRIDQDRIEFDTNLTEAQKADFHAILNGNELEGSRATAILAKLFGTHRSQAVA